MKRLSSAFLFILVLSPSADAKYRKKQDADYLKQYCAASNGKEEISLPNGLRPDCTTETHVIEVDSAEDWNKNLIQALGYGQSGNKRAKLVLVLEEPEQESYFQSAKQKIDSEKLPIDLDRIENFLSKSESLAEIDGPIVKKSKSGICHVKGCGSYGATKTFTQYETLAACLNDHGTLPGNLKEDTMWSCETAASGSSSKSLVIK